MKSKFITALASIAAFFGTSGTTSALAETSADNALSVRLNDALWDGKSIPDGQQCLRFGGEKPATPPLKISGIPTSTNLLILEYSDRSFEPMNHGGHGRMAYALSRPAQSVELPAVPGHSFELPTGFISLGEHRNPKWDKAGTYMPPCSGGKGNAYYVTVQAVHYDGFKTEVLAKTVLEMGLF